MDTVDGVRPTAALLFVGAVVAGSCGADKAAIEEPIVLVDLVAASPEIRPGDIIALRTDVDDGVLAVEWIERRTGRIQRLPLGSLADTGGPELDDLDADDLAADIETVATIDVGIDGEQRGLLGHTVVDGARYAAWTDPSNDLIVGEVDSDGPVRIVWNGGGTVADAVGGHLESDAGGQLLLGIGQLTDWANEHGSGAMLRLDPAGAADQEPLVVSDGYINPFAFVVEEEALWVADNAVGEDIERIGRGDLGGRATFPPSDADPRAPSATLVLDDGSLAVCGFLDGQLRLWSPTDAAYGEALGPCLTGATTLPDGSIVAATAHALVLLPAASR